MLFQMSGLISLLVVSMAVAAVSMTLSKGKIFSGTREWLDDKSEFLGDLIHCPYCTSHYVAFGAVLIFQPFAVTSGWFIPDVLLASFATVAMSSYWCGVIYSSYAQMGDDEEGEE
jgi:hypothetical protein